MKKKNLIVLLLIPFIISLVGIVTINVTFNFIETDITGIKWNYNDTEGYSINESEKIKLEATGEKLASAVLAPGNELTWSVKNKDSSITEPLAEIVYEGGNYYLVPKKEGEVIVTCSNQKGNIFRSMNVVLYDVGAIILNPKIKSSQNNIDPTIYYGEYDLVSKKKQKAKIEYDVSVIPNSFKSQLDVKSKTDNVKFDLATGTVEVLDGGKANITLGVDNEDVKDVSLSFDIVHDGVNVYDYDDLLYCTNESAEGEIVVLRKSFESRIKVSTSTTNNVEMFGDYDSSTDKYSFDKEVYKFETTYNQEYIKQWNEFAANKAEYSSISNEVKAALHVQKDFYGNGYTLNFHNLTFPYLTVKKNDESGKEVETYELREDNLFRGPLPFYTLGNPNGMPLVTALGQDNVGMYVDGNDILVNDVNIRNCDIMNSLTNLDYVGTVLEVNGDNNVVKNSRLSNGKNVLRSFSSNNLLIDNCMLSTSRNFLVSTGSNEYVKHNDEIEYTFKKLDGSSVRTTIKEFLAKNGPGDEIITKFIEGKFEDKKKMKEALVSINNALNDQNVIKNNFKGSMNINDTLFYQSGISAISLETYFNGAYLYDNIPSLIGSMFSDMKYDDAPLVPLEANGIAGSTYPVKVNISGNTRFYDYKDTTTLDISGLITENISVVANTLYKEQNLRKITIDDIFPIKTMLVSQAKSSGSVYTNEQGSYINIPIAYYGGGVNLSEVTFDNYQYSNNYLSDPVVIDFMNQYIELPHEDNLIRYMKNLMLKMVMIVTGSEPFRFVTIENNNVLFDETFNKAPNVSMLIENAKGE